MDDPHVIIVAYGAPEPLERCLTALEGHTEVLVVDNSSSPAVRSVVAEHGATYLDPHENLGFGAGVNLALQRLTARPQGDVLLLNPDAAIAPADLRKLSAHLRRPGNERVGALSPRLVHADGSAERVEWPFPSPSRAWSIALGLSSLGRRSDSFVIGAALLLRGEAIREVGLFDERFFLYAEETDWQRRALDLGWRSGMCEEAVATHLGSGTSGDPVRREVLFHAAQETYIRKWFGTPGWWSYRTAVCVGGIARVVMLGGDRRSAAFRRTRLYIRGPRKCAALARS